MALRITHQDLKVAAAELAAATGRRFDVITSGSGAGYNLIVRSDDSSKGHSTVKNGLGASALYEWIGEYKAAYEAGVEAGEQYAKNPTCVYVFDENGHGQALNYYAPVGHYWSSIVPAPHVLRFKNQILAERYVAKHNIKANRRARPNEEVEGSVYYRTHRLGAFHDSLNPGKPE